MPLVFSPIMSSISLKTQRATSYYSHHIDYGTFERNQRYYLPVFNRAATNDREKYGFIHKEYAVQLGLKSNLIVLTGESTQNIEYFRLVGVLFRPKPVINETPKKTSNSFGYSSI